MIVFAPTSGVRRWVNEELTDEPGGMQPVASLGEAVNLAREAEQNALLIVDMASLDEIGILALQMLRDEGWNGKLIMLGDVSRRLLRALRVSHAISRPFGSETLRAFVSDVRLHRDTVRITPLRR